MLSNIPKPKPHIKKKVLIPVQSGQPFPNYIGNQGVQVNSNIPGAQIQTNVTQLGGLPNYEYGTIRSGYSASNQPRSGPIAENSGGVSMRSNPGQRLSQGTIGQLQNLLSGQGGRASLAPQSNYNQYSQDFLYFVYFLNFLLFVFGVI